MTALHAVLVGAFIPALVIAQETVSIRLPASPPNGASAVVNPSFAGFGIEASNLFSFAGYDTPNEITMNCLQNLANYTGYPPHIRLGGNTQDYMYYSDSQTRWTWVNNPNSKGQGAYASDSMLIGPRFYEAANRFPKGTPITYGLNLAYEGTDYVDQITTMATKAIQGLSNLELVSFEIGNEPDLYLANQFRTGSWDGQVYTNQWLDRAYWVYDQVLKPAGRSSDFFESAQTASTIGTTFGITNLDKFNIAQNANGTGKPYLSSWNQHDYYYYIGVSTYPLTLERFMTLETTKDQFGSWVEQIGEAAKTPIPYALREMGVVGPIGMSGITDVFGAALWALNFLLYTSTLNISSVQLHMTDNSNASAWNPMNLYGTPAYVRPLYYGIAAFDQIIGPSCQARVYNDPITVPDTYTGKVEAYSVYQGNTLASIVVINGMMANASETDKGSLAIQLSLPSQFAGKDLYLAYLTNDGADSMHNTTWNGISFEQSDNGTPTQVMTDPQSVTIGSDGSATITVRDSQAVVGSIASPVGQVEPNSSACASLKAQATTVTSPSSATSSSAAGGGSGTRAKVSSTNGVLRLSSMVMVTLASSLTTAAFLLLV